MKTWLQNIAAGRWRTVWKPDRRGERVPHQGARECQRRRLRLLGLKGPAYRHDEVYRGDLLGAILLAQATEYSHTHVSHAA